MYVFVCVCVCVCVCVLVGSRIRENVGRNVRKEKLTECERHLSVSVMNSPSAFVHG